MADRLRAEEEVESARLFVDPLALSDAGAVELLLNAALHQTGPVPISTSQPLIPAPPLNDVSHSIHTGLRRRTRTRTRSSFVGALQSEFLSRAAIVTSRKPSLFCKATASESPNIDHSRVTFALDNTITRGSASDTADVKNSFCLSSCTSMNMDLSTSNLGVVAPLFPVVALELPAPRVDDIGGHYTTISAVDRMFRARKQPYQSIQTLATSTLSIPATESARPNVAVLADNKHVCFILFTQQCLSILILFAVV